MQLFRGSSAGELRKTVLNRLAARRLPPVAERDVVLALDRVHPEGQLLLIQAAEDAALPFARAVERLSCLWVFAAAVNLADDLADGDCDYLPPRVGEGVAFLLQSFAWALAARSELSQPALETCGIRLVNAAAGQSLEVRATPGSARDYLEIAELIAGDQYAAYLRLLWDGSPLEPVAVSLGRALGAVGLVMTDVESQDGRLTGLDEEQRAQVFAYCRARLGELQDSGVPSLVRFVNLARAALPV